MLQAGVRCDLVVFPGQDHGFWNPHLANQEYFYQVLQGFDAFLVSLGWLSGPSTLPLPPSYAVAIGSAGSESLPQVHVGVIPVNDAPVLDNTLNPSLGSILEDAKNPAGTLIKYLANPAISDVDEGAVKGLAVVSAYGANGDWQFSLDGVVWQSMSGASESAARLLPVDATTRVRFVPKPDYNGPAWLGYRAWDQTEGSAGETLSTAGRLGVTETFSVLTEAAKVTVTAVNDAPVVSLSGTIGYLRNQAAVVLAPYARMTDVDSQNFEGGRLKVRIASGKSNYNLLAIGAGFTVDEETFEVRQGTTIIGTLNPGGGKGATELVVTFNASATKAIVQQLVRSITFRTLGGSAGTRVLKFSVSDGDGGLSSEATKTVNVT
jgi:trimeric autotransporter adhesin